jgi:argininosuccinate synthase
MERIILAYSGGLDTSVAIPWLKEHHDAEIVTVTMDLGQERELEAVRDRALAIGAIRAHVLDVREPFVHEFVVPALKADALFDDRSPMTAALARPLIAQKLVEIAEIEHAQAVAHGGGGVGRRAAFDALIRALNPKLKIIAPARDWGMTRSEVVSYGRAHGVPLPANVDSPYRSELNLWGRSIECSTLEDEPPEEIYTLTKPARECPDEPAYVEIQFDRGAPAAVNHVAMPMSELIGALNIIASTHGVGRIDVVEHRVGSTRLREVGEAPAAVLLHAAHRELRRITAPRELERFCRTVSGEYADIIYAGLWFSPLRKALNGFVDSVQERLSGVVRLKLFKGAYSIVARNAVTAPAPVMIPMAKP